MHADSLNIDFWVILQALRRWFFLILSLVVLGTGVAAYLVERITPTYAASTTLEVKQEERNILDVSNVESVIANYDFIQTQIELLGSESLIRDVVEGLNLITDSDFVGDPELTSGLSREQRVRRAIGVARSKLSVSSVDKSRLIRLSFEHSNPKKAALIVNTTAETFISNSLARKFNSTQYAREFLESRLEAVRVSLEAAERELVNYASDGAIISTSADGVGGGQSLDRIALISIDSELTEAFVARLEAESAFNSWNDANASTEILDSTVISNLKRSRIDLQDEYLTKRGIFKPDYPEMKELQNRIDELSRQIQLEEGSIISTERGKLERDLQLATDREKNLSQKLEELKVDVVDTSVKSINLNILQRQVDSERTQYDALLQRLKEITVSGQIGESLVQVVDESFAPEFPFKPRKSMILLLAFLSSLGVALGLVYFIEIIDDRIKGPSDLLSKLNLNALGVIPRIRGNEEEIVADLVDPSSTLAEAYASVRTNLQFSAGAPQVVQITSARPSEGKSTSALALAVSFAALDDEVLLIDCDIRYPTFTANGDKTKGVTGLLTSNERIVDHVIKDTIHPKLHILTAGRKVNNPSEILSRPRFTALIEEARETYKYVVIDSPPVLGLADAPIIGANVDGAVFVTEAQKLRTPNIQRSLERLRKSGTVVLGGVLNKFKVKQSNYYSSDYYGGYGYGKGPKEDGGTNFWGETKGASPSHKKNTIDITR